MCAERSVIRPHRADHIWRWSCLIASHPGENAACTAWTAILSKKQSPDLKLKGHLTPSVLTGSSSPTRNYNHSQQLSRSHLARKAVRRVRMNGEAMNDACQLICILGSECNAGRNETQRTLIKTRCGPWIRCNHPVNVACENQRFKNADWRFLKGYYSTLVKGTCERRMQLRHPDFQYVWSWILHFP